jgi:hypothetical protein
MSRARGAFVVVVGVLGLLILSPDTRAGDAGSCQAPFNPEDFCLKFITTQTRMRIDGGEEEDLEHPRTSHTWVAILTLQDSGKDLIRLLCDIKFNQNRTNSKVLSAEVVNDIAWTPEADTFLRKYDACRPDTDYSKLIEAYQKQTGEDYTSP